MKGAILQVTTNSLHILGGDKLRYVMAANNFQKPESENLFPMLLIHNSFSNSFTEDFNSSVLEAEQPPPSLSEVDIFASCLQKKPSVQIKALWKIMPAVYTIAYVVYNQLHKQMGMYNHYREKKWTNVWGIYVDCGWKLSQSESLCP